MLKPVFWWKDELLLSWCPVFRTNCRGPTNAVMTCHSVSLHLRTISTQGRKKGVVDSLFSGFTTGCSFDKNISCQPHLKCCYSASFCCCSKSLSSFLSRSGYCHLLEYRPWFKMGIHCQWKDCTLRWLVTCWSSLTGGRKIFHQSAKQRMDQILWFVIVMN